MNILGIFGAIDWDSHESHDKKLELILQYMILVLLCLLMEN